MLKKIVILIVEGDSEQAALELILNKIARLAQVRFLIVKGDITSAWNTTKQKLLSRAQVIL